MVDGSQAEAVRAEQGPVADDVDESRYAARQPVYLASSAFVEYIDQRPGHAKAVFDIGIRFRLGQRLQVVAAGNPLCELPQFVAAEQIAQLRLANQNDLQEFLFCRFEIGQKTHFFENFGSEVLRFIHQQDRSSAFAMGFQKV